MYCTHGGTDSDERSNVKNLRKASDWTNEEIAESPSEYLQAQQAEEEDQAAGAAGAREEADRKRYTEAYVAAGGSRSEAGEAYRAHKGQQAEQAAATDDEQARRVHWHETMRRV